LSFFAPPGEKRHTQGEKSGDRIYIRTYTSGRFGGPQALRESLFWR